MWSTNKVVFVVVVELGLCWTVALLKFRPLPIAVSLRSVLLQIEDTFDILKFSIIVSLRGHKQTMFHISKVAHR